MNELYDIPKRLKKKSGIFGQIAPIDIGISVALVLTGFILALTLSNTIGIVILLAAAVISYFFFIAKDMYDENYRVKLLRMLEFNKKQKIFYYYRGTK